MGRGFSFDGEGSGVIIGEVMELSNEGRDSIMEGKLIIKGEKLSVVEVKPDVTDGMHGVNKGKEDTGAGEFEFGVRGVVGEFGERDNLIGGDSDGDGKVREVSDEGLDSMVGRRSAGGLIKIRHKKAFLS